LIPSTNTLASADSGCNTQRKKLANAARLAAEVLDIVDVPTS
jgi:hypothetical protein